MVHECGFEVEKGDMGLEMEIAVVLNRTFPFLFWMTNQSVLDLGFAGVPFLGFVGFYRQLREGEDRERC